MPSTHLQRPAVRLRLLHHILHERLWMNFKLYSNKFIINILVEKLPLDFTRSRYDSNDSVTQTVIVGQSCVAQAWSTSENEASEGRRWAHAASCNLRAPLHRQPPELKRRKVVENQRGIDREQSFPE